VYPTTRPTAHSTVINQMLLVELSLNICIRCRTRWSVTTVPDDGSRVLEKQSSAGTRRCSAVTDDMNEKASKSYKNISLMKQLTACVSSQLAGIPMHKVQQLILPP